MVEPSDILSTFTPTQDGYFLTLEINPERLRCDIYHANRHGIELHDTQVHPQWANDVSILTVAGKDEALLYTILAELGVYWTEIDEIQLDLLIKELVPLIEQFSRTLKAGYTPILQVTLLGYWSQFIPIQQAISHMFDTQTGIIWEPVYTHWSLAPEQAITNYLKEINSASVPYYFDLLTLEIFQEKLRWKRIPLLTPDKRSWGMHHTLHLAPNSQVCHFFVGQFNEPDNYIAEPNPQMIAAAYRLQVRRRTTLNYRVEYIHQKVEVFFENINPDDITDILPDASYILEEQLPDVHLDAIPMQTVFLVDGTIGTSLFQRCSNFIEMLLANQASNHQWLFWIYAHQSYSPLFTSQFQTTSEFLQRLRDYNQRDYRHEYQRTRYGVPVDMSKALLALSDQVKWAKGSSRYLITLTRLASQSDIGEIMQHILRQKYDLKSILIWLEQDHNGYDMAEKTRYLQSLSNELPVSFNNLYATEQLFVMRDQITSLLQPPQNQRVRIQELAWPLDREYANLMENL